MIITEEQKTQSAAFFREALEILAESKAAYLIGGAFAVFQHTGIYRNTKDLDIFCKHIDYPGILKTFMGKGYDVKLTDSRWLAKIIKGEYFIDVIFDTVNNICKVDESWFTHAVKGTFEGYEVSFLAPEELIWLKSYVQNRERFDGADINHIILRTGRNIDWARLLERLDQHWQILLSEILIFQFAYPAEYRQIIPKWLFDELLRRASEQYEIPESEEKVCRGPLLDQTQYAIDIRQWEYKVTTIMTV